MCGIIGYTGHRPAIPLVLEGLEHLEYRGYDSSGVGYVFKQELKIVKAEGKLYHLKEKFAGEGSALTVSSAIGHTRWATHGAPLERNAHPHVSNDGRLALVHNGIIENYLEIKKELVAKGYHFESDTDTEVLVNLISSYVQNETDILEPLAQALRRAKGAFAICLMDRLCPDKLYAARLQAPLIVGLGTGENFIASDVPAFLAYTREVLFLEDHEILVASPQSYELLSLKDLSKIERSSQQIKWSLQAAQKGGFKHFMLKEIFEQPRVITEGLAGRLDGEDGILLPELEALAVPKRLHIVACGTSYHAGLWGEHLLESWAKIPVQVEIASEFRYKEDLLLDPKEDMLLVISQSGETADTLAALRRAKEAQIQTLGLCNVLGSSIAREAQATIYTQAGPEISVASTKAMTSQMLMLAILALYYGERKKVLSPLVRHAE
ncbi:MAG: glutamine--fructose-6-phosphate transaminase (isomerizing), partial [Desulfovibrionaceae bacterium]|nr:glutamine--fructose-6-phosphate transaminase (isomerizing) [Desulfovibrionaceae bacterium]